MLLSVTYGRETFSHANAQAQIFVMTGGNFTVPRREKHLWSAGKDGDVEVTRRGGVTRINASNAARRGAEMGSWMTAMYEVPEGLFMKVMATRKALELTAGRHITAAMVLHMREEAKLHRIKVGLTRHPKATVSEVVVAQGRFDIFTIAEAYEAGEVTVPRKFIPMFKEFNQRAIFTVEVLEPEISPFLMPEMEETTNTSGDTVRVRSRGRRRAVQLR